MNWLLEFNIPHLHLVLNHVPTVGSVVALSLLIVAFARRDEGLKHAGLEVVFAIALLAVPAYMTGVGAAQKIRRDPGISITAVRVHQDVALAALTVTEFAGFIAWVALWQSRRRGRPAAGLIAATLVLTALSLAIASRAATLGGEIHHPEIRADAAAAAAADEPAENFVAGRISNFMVNSPWAWPAAETLHFLGLSLSMGILLAVNLRILGAMRKIAFADIHRLLPWGMLGFGINLITGMIFFVGQPGQYLASGPFYWKVVFLMVAGANFLYLTVFRKAWTPGDAAVFDASLSDKAMAITSLFAWFAVLYLGRMLPFIGKAF